MKKLIYNEITKEINIIEQDECDNKKIKKNRIRKFFRRNKIFFETILMVAIAVVTIIVYMIGNSINDRNKEISRKELEILESDREPQFVVERNVEKEEKTDFGESVDFTVKNIGGTLTDSRLFPIYQYTLYWRNLKVGIQFDTYKHLEIPFCYNKKTKKFKCRYMKNDAFVIEIMNRIGANVLKGDCYVEIWYINYKNEQYFSYYQLGINGMNLINKDEIETDIEIYISKGMSVEDVIGEIQRQSEGYNKEDT